MKKIATLVLALVVSTFAVDFTLSGIEIVSGYGVDAQLMEFEAEGLTVDVQDSTSIQIRVDSPYQFETIGFYVEWNDTTIELDNSKFEKGDLFGSAGAFTFNQIEKNKVYVYADIPEGETYDTKQDQLITRFVVAIDKVTNKARIYFIVE